MGQPMFYLTIKVQCSLNGGAFDTINEFAIDKETGIEGSVPPVGGGVELVRKSGRHCGWESWD